MSALFTFPKQVAFNDGAILPGGKLWFFQTGTTTPQDTFQEEALTTPHTNPVEADADGVLEPIYLDPTLPNYRVRFTDANDVQLWQVDGVPSNQNLQQSVRLESTNPFVFLYDTDGTSGSRKYRIRAAGAAFEVQAVNEDETVFTTILQFTGGVLYSNATEVAVTSSGTFTGTLTGMTAATTGTVNYRKVNNIVTLWLQAQIVGTSNSTAMTMTGLPAAIVPTVGRVLLSASGSDSGAEVCLANVVTAVNTILFQTLDSSVAKLTPAGVFTNSGSKGLFNGWSITYAVA